MPHKLIDLSHPIEDGMITYKGLPAPVICVLLSREAFRAHYTGGTEYQIGKIELVAKYRHLCGQSLPPLCRWNRFIGIAT